MTEAELQKAVIDLAHLLKWRVAHFRPAMNTRGQWMTPVAGDGAGFPDLLMVRDEHLIFAELKSEKGRMSTEQDAWFDALRWTGATLAVWRPRHWENGVIERCLGRDA